MPKANNSNKSAAISTIGYTQFGEVCEDNSAPFLPSSTSSNYSSCGTGSASSNSSSNSCSPTAHQPPSYGLNQSSFSLALNPDYSLNQLIGGVGNRENLGPHHHFHHHNHHLLDGPLTGYSAMIDDSKYYLGLL